MYTYMHLVNDQAVEATRVAACQVDVLLWGASCFFVIGVTAHLGGCYSAPCSPRVHGWLALGSDVVVCRWLL
jgi:hypothetical protein